MSITEQQQHRRSGRGRSTPTRSTRRCRLRGAVHGRRALRRRRSSDFEADLVDGRARGLGADREPRDQGREPARPPDGARLLRRRALPRGLASARRRRRASGNEVAFEGEITIKGISQPATLRGTLTGPVTDPYGNDALRPRLETTIDRTAFGITWNADMPDGSKALADDVTLKADLSLVKAGLSDAHPRASPAASARDSHNTLLLRAAAELLGPERRARALARGWRDVPPYDQDADVEPAPAAVAALRDGGRGGRRRPHRDARVQLLDPGRAQERARLGLAAVSRRTPSATSRSR